MKNSEVQLRPATLQDLTALLQLEAESFDYSRIGRRSFRHLLNAHSCHIEIAERDGELLAYGMLLSRRNSTRWRLYSIAVAKAAQGTGLGKRLLLQLMALVKQRGGTALSLEVKCDNRAAIGLYEHLGFAVVDILPGYYDDGVDGYRMRLTFSDVQGNR